MRFLQVNPQLAFLRETHRLVLAWTSFEGREVHAFTVTLTRGDLAACKRALGAEAVQWTAANGLLDLRGNAQELVLSFRNPGEDGGKELRLAGEDRARFASGVATLARG